MTDISSKTSQKNLGSSSKPVESSVTSESDSPQKENIENLGPLPERRLELRMAVKRSIPPLRPSFEIWAMIIKYTQSGEENFNVQFKNLHNYARVCRKLCAIVLQAPELWSELVHLPSPSLAFIALKRSRGAPLTVRYTNTWIPQKIFKTLLPHIHRVRVLQVEASRKDAQKLLEKLEGDGSPILQKLEITDRRSSTLNDISMLVRLPSPNMRRVKFTANHISLDNLHISPSLTELELELHPRELTVFARYSSFLSSLPNLVELRFDVNERLLQPLTWPIQQEITPIVLPHLRKLELYHLPGRITSGLLRYIQSDECKEITVVANASQGVEDLQVSSLSTQSAMSRVLVAPTLIEIRTDSDRNLEMKVVREVEPQCERTQLYIKVHRHTNRSELAHSLLTDIDRSNVRILKLFADKFSLAPLTASSLPCFLSLEYLSLWNIEACDPILIALRDADHPQSWICPNLTSLHLRGNTWYQGSHLLEMLESRYGGQLPKLSIPQALAPEPFDRLAIIYIGRRQHSKDLLDNDQRERIKNIVGINRCEFIDNKNWPKKGDEY
ncbi:hypothetical protein FRC02_002890 [Tulasnella sp. 418]|nr:hypothetical protein FRC02_002890 [Tulasnella sp. 418]